MRLIEKKKERIYFCGIPFASEKVRGDYLQLRILGVPCSRRYDRMADLVTRVAESKDFDSRALDRQIADYFADKLQNLPYGIYYRRKYSAK